MSEIMRNRVKPGPAIEAQSPGKAEFPGEIESAGGTEPAGEDIFSKRGPRP